MSKLKEKNLEFLYKLDPTQFFAPLWGFAHCEGRCKVCSSCFPTRTWIEWAIRSGIHYREIIEFAAEATDGRFLLNKTNLSLHSSKHMTDDLLSVIALPDGEIVPLLPRGFLKTIPYQAVEGQIVFSKCALPYSGCRWREPEGCTFKGDCPAKHLQQTNPAEFVIDCTCEICVSPYRLVIEFLAGGDSNGK